MHVYKHNDSAAPCGAVQRRQELLCCAVWRAGSMNATLCRVAATGCGDDRPMYTLYYRPNGLLFRVTTNASATLLFALLSCSALINWFSRLMR